MIYQLRVTVLYFRMMQSSYKMFHTRFHLQDSYDSYKIQSSYKILIINCTNSAESLNRSLSNKFFFKVKINTYERYSFSLCACSLRTSSTFPDTSMKQAHSVASPTFHIQLLRTAFQERLPEILMRRKPISESLMGANQTTDITAQQNYMIKQTADMVRLTPSEELQLVTQFDLTSSEGDERLPELFG